MLVARVETVRADVNESYRGVLKAADIPRSSFSRWRSRIGHQEPCVETPGPKKAVQMDLEAILAEVRELEHGRRRSRGTTTLYQTHREAISRRQMQGLVKDERQRVNAVRLAKLRKVTWQVSGMAWAMDNTELGLMDLHQVQDLASRYKYASFVTASVQGEQVAEHLEGLIRTHGAPLILKRDRGSNLRSEAVEAVLQNHLIIPLDSPPRYPAYNGAIEHAQRETKELVAVRYPGAGQILACHAAVAQELNHRPRPCLQGRTSCAVLESGREAMKAYTRPKRKEVIDWIKKEMLAILQAMGGSSAGVRACDAAWRRAVETWLHRNGAITVSVNGKVLPCYP